MSECKDYKLETLRAILPDFDDKNISIADAWVIFQKGKEEGAEILLNDLKEFVKVQEKYDKDKAKGEIGEVISSLKALLNLWKGHYTEYELEYLLEKRQDAIVRAINLLEREIE